MNASEHARGGGCALTKGLGSVSVDATVPRLRALLRDSLSIVVVGTGLALAANALSPAGISLTRNYFHDEPARPRAATRARAVQDEKPLLAPAGESAPARLSARGFALQTHDEVVALFRDPRFARGGIVFIDARGDAPYGAGHIPGAYQLDHYHREKHLPQLVAAAQVAEQIVIYCTGGTCEDSELAAVDLVEIGIPLAKISVYQDGIGEWQKRGLPVETGGRGSGQFVAPR